MGKLHKTLRIEEADAARVSELRAEGESEAAAYARVISAGLAALEGAESREEAATGEAGALVRSLSEHIDTLKAANEELSRQLGVKDGQIEALTAITQAAQLLDGYGRRQIAEPIAGEPADAGGQEAQASEATGSQEEPKKRGIMARIFG